MNFDYEKSKRRIRILTIVINTTIFLVAVSIAAIIFSLL
jgi:flagellar basal body-associated protein FliL